MLEMVLVELREFKADTAKQLCELNTSVVLLKNEVARQGEVLGGLEASCSKRLRICSARDRSNGSSSPSSWTPEDESEAQI